MKTSLALLAVVLLWTMGCRERSPHESAASPIPDTAQEPAGGIIPGYQSPEDKRLSREVWEAIWPLLEIQDTNDFHVVSQDGLVVLRGRVANMNLRNDLTRSVMQLPGVTGVDNQLVVDPSVDMSAQRLRDPDLQEEMRAPPVLP